VFAARLAAEGMTGPYEAFDGVFGLWKQTLGTPREILDFARGGATYAVQQSNIKMYPVRDSCQLPVSTALALAAKLPAADIAKLRIITYKSAHKGAAAEPELWAPKTRETADHSMPVAIAIGLIDRAVTPETFERQRFLDADVLDLISRTEVVVSDKFSAETPAVRNCRLEATDRAGKVHIAHLKLTAEDIGRGPDDADLEAKFMTLTRALLPERARRRLYRALLDIDACDDVGDVVELTAI
jgi:2-methylcitrate dehydratase